MNNKYGDQRQIFSYDLKVRIQNNDAWQHQTWNISHLFSLLGRQTKNLLNKKQIAKSNRLLSIQEMEISAAHLHIP